MNILVISASMNDPSNSDFLADRFMETLKEAGADVEKIRLKDTPLEHFTLKHYDQNVVNEPAFTELEEKIKSANGVVIATPVWNFSVPAQLKNLLDRMGSFGLDAERRTRGQLKGKPFFLIFTGGAPQSAWALQSMTTSHVPVSLKYFGATIFGTYFEGRCTQGPGRSQFRLVVDQRADSVAAIHKHARRYATMVEGFSKTGKLPLGMKLKERMYAVGQRIVKSIT